jgi:hypothetical protein
MIALHASQKNLFSVEPLDKSGSLDFIEQAQIPEVLVRNALRLRIVQGYQIEHEADRFRVGRRSLATRLVMSSYRKLFTAGSEFFKYLAKAFKLSSLSPVMK